MPPYKKPLSSIRLPSIRNISTTNKLMGCASSQAAQVKIQPENVPDTAAPANDSSTTAENETIANSESQISDISEKSKYPPAEAFEIPLDNLITSSPDDNNTDQISSENLIKKHPPKRLQRLVEQSHQQEMTASTTTIEDLEEKLAKAEIRRQKYLQKRVDTVLSLAQPIGIPSTPALPTTTTTTTTTPEMTTAQNEIEENINDITVVTVNNKSEQNSDLDDSDEFNNPGKIQAPDTNNNNNNVDRNEEEYNNSNRNNSNNKINHSSLRNYTVGKPIKIPTNDSVNKPAKYMRSPGDGDESKDEILEY